MLKTKVEQRASFKVELYKLGGADSTPIILTGSDAVKLKEEITGKYSLALAAKSDKFKITHKLIVYMNKGGTWLPAGYSFFKPDGETTAPVKAPMRNPLKIVKRWDNKTLNEDYTRLANGVIIVKRGNVLAAWEPEKEGTKYSSILIIEKQRYGRIGSALLPEEIANRNPGNAKLIQTHGFYQNNNNRALQAIAAVYPEARRGIKAHGVITLINEATLTERLSKIYGRPGDLSAFVEGGKAETGIFLAGYRRYIEAGLEIETRADFELLAESVNIKLKS